MIAGRDWSRVRVVGVSRLANYLKRKLESDANLAELGVQGEISNLRAQPSGNLYFDVKDRDAVLACFAFASDAATFPEVKNGAAVTVYGRVSTYEKRSTYQLVARHLELEGVGRLYARYEELKRKLDAEGLFREDRKRSLPRFPFRVALVGSPSGDGTRDFLTQARLRAPHVAVRLVATPVQGDVAPQIVAALRQACALHPDLVVLARGGGSFEDLFVFSDERLVRAVAACPVPIVTAIGHEADVPLVDFAADRRAATPSTAAQTVLPRRDDLARELTRDRERIGRALQGRIGRARASLQRIEHRSPLADPRLLLSTRRQRIDGAREALRRNLTARLGALHRRLGAVARQVEAKRPAALAAARRERLAALRGRLAPAAFRALAEQRGRIDDLGERLDATFRRTVERAERRFALAKAGLDAVDPHAPLRRGYAIVARRDGKVVLDPADAPPGTPLRLTVARGELAARVEPEGTDGGEQIGLF